MKDSPDSSRQRQHAWTHAVAVRMRTLWLTKMLGTSLSIAAFFPIYFWIMQATAYRAAPVPVTGLDAWLGVQQWAIVPYASLWLYVSLPAAFAANRQALLTYASGALVMVVTGLTAASTSVSCGNGTTATTVQPGGTATLTFQVKLNTN